MDLDRKILWFVVVLGCVLGTNGQTIVDLLSYTAESAVAAVLDGSVQPPPLNSGFDQLVPQQSIRLHCAKPSATYYNQVFFGESNVGQKINLTRPLTIAIHGWVETSNVTLFSRLSSSYRKFVPNDNFCLLDWGPYAQFNYTTAARRSVPLVAEYLFGFLQNLNAQYYPMANVTLIGFSMGGQIASLTGKSLLGRIGTIYALDPAGPLFTLPFDVGPTKRLTKSDAAYVQVLYTSRNAIGMGPIVGHENFLSNGGYHPQPPCLGLVVTNFIQAFRCSHEYAVTLFTNALDPANVIRGTLCPSVLGVPLCILGGGVTDRLAVYAQRISGDFYL